MSTIWDDRLQRIGEDLMDIQALEKDYEIEISDDYVCMVNRLLDTLHSNLEQLYDVGVDMCLTKKALQEEVNADDKCDASRCEYYQTLHSEE